MFREKMSNLVILLFAGSRKTSLLTELEDKIDDAIVDKTTELSVKLNLKGHATQLHRRTAN